MIHLYLRIGRLIDNREGGKEAEENTEIESCVYCEESYDGFGEEHHDWPRNGNREYKFHLLCGCHGCHWIRRWWQIESFRSFVKDDLLVCLFLEKAHYDNAEANHQNDPLSPSPGFELCQITTCDGSYVC